MTKSEVREELKEIRYYYSRKADIDSLGKQIGTNKMIEKLERYNAAMQYAPIILFDLYGGIYLNNNTQESLAEKWGYSTVQIQRLNTKLIAFLYSQFTKEEI